MVWKWVQSNTRINPLHFTNREKRFVKMGKRHLYDNRKKRSWQIKDKGRTCAAFEIISNENYWRV